MSNEWYEIEKEKAKEQVLNDKEILELARLVARIENHYGFPVDVEWTREGNRLFITQSRPITTLTKTESSQAEKIWIPIIRRRGESVLMTSYLLTAYQDQYHQEILHLPRGIHDTKYLDGVVIVEANDIGKFESNLAERLTAEYLAFFISKCRLESDRLLRTAHEIRSKTPYTSMTNSELHSLFTTYSNDVIRVMPFLFGIVVLEGALQKELEVKLTRHCQQYNIKADPKSYLASLIFPKEKNTPSLAIIELYQLASQVHTNSSLRKLFDLEPNTALMQLKEKIPAIYEKI